MSEAKPKESLMERYARLKKKIEEKQKQEEEKKQQEALAQVPATPVEKQPTSPVTTGDATPEAPPSLVASSCASVSSASSVRSSPSPDRNRRRRSFSICSDGSVDEFGRMKRKGDNSESEVEEDTRGRRAKKNGVRPDKRSRRQYTYSESDSSDDECATGAHQPLNCPDARLYLEAASYLETAFYRKTIYVGNLAPLVTEPELMTIFRAVGEVKNIRLFSGKSYAFVTYQSSSEAREALSKLDNYLIHGVPMRVGRAKIPERNRGGFGGVPWMDHDAARGPNFVVNTGSVSVKSISQLPIDPRAAAGRQLLRYDL
ncbi:hypothetical protein HDV00_009877 [Rhizophlyctis rosea]|nr:hypothetical protein HDV00_009877 [Rhizophlyctis rosea]